MSELMMQPDEQGADGGSSQPSQSGSARPPRAEDEGLSAREIRWIPVIVPLAALTLLLAAAAVLGTA